MMKEKKQLPVERNDEIELDIVALGSEGQGIGRVEGYAIFVPGALPGERVKAHVIKAGAGYGVGKLMKIISASPQRITPLCGQHGRCGGCTLQHLAYPAQLDYKRQLVEDALKRIGGFENPIVAPVLGMENPWQYRNKGSFPLAMVDGRVKIGFYAPRSHRLIPMEDCFIEQEPVVLAAQTVRDWANAFAIPAYDEQTGQGILRHVMARETTTGQVMAVVIARKKPPRQKELVEMLQERIEGLKSVYLNLNTADTNVIAGREYDLLWGEARVQETLCGLAFSISPASFLQVNSLQTEKLYQTALEFLKLQGQERVVDAYCGIGTISLLLAKHAGEVVGIEDVPQAVEDAKANALANNMENARFLCAPAEQALPALLKEGFVPDAIVADPPRKGCDAAFLQAVLQSGVRRMVYVSCNPATLARDCQTLSLGGFVIEKVQPVDLFPHSSHVETVVLLTKA